jgi:spore coat polysaccharide biosynthesis protein SpsF
MKTVGCIIARTNSTRLPQKVLKEIKDKKLIEHIIQKMKKAQNLDELYLCTSIDKKDRILLEIAKKNGIKSFAGSRESVIDRMLKVADMENADNMVRITGDNIFTDEIFLDKMIKEHIRNESDYTRTEYLPLGVTSEVINVDSLKKCYNEIDPNKSEYLTVYMFDPKKYNCLILIPPEKFKHPFLTLTVDTLEDYERTLFLMNELSGEKDIYLDDILDINNKKNVPNININKSNKIKLPDGRKITFNDYRKILDKKINNSNIIKLEENFYEKNKR